VQVHVVDVVDGAAVDGLIHVAAAGLAPADQAHGERVADNRQVNDQVAVEIASSVRHRGGLGGQRPANAAQFRLVADHAQRAVHRARAEQRALRSLQHFHALDVDQAQARGAVAAEVVLEATLQR
jgi:hypothetical protein